jgi:myo-inositol-1(or 4)-monophosphatase
MAFEDRLDFAIETARRAGEVGLAHFRRLETLQIESKGHQDMVSNADRELETLVRDAIAATFPDDGIVGEEHGRTPGTSGYTWIIDPIDGTANFVRGIPAWCVVIACVDAAGPVVGVTHEPSVGETFAASRGGGATLNGKPMNASPSRSLADGSMGVGFSNRVEVAPILRFIDALTGEGGVFYRNASGALMLAYVAAGRLIGYAEPHMNPWDCVAGLLQIEEAGGETYPVAPETMLAEGGPVIAGAAGVYERTRRLALEAFRPEAEPAPSPQG